jgi:hypothetical protein
MKSQYYCLYLLLVFLLYISVYKELQNYTNITNSSIVLDFETYNYSQALNKMIEFELKINEQNLTSCEFTTNGIILFDCKYPDILAKFIMKKTFQILENSIYYGWTYHDDEEPTSTLKSKYNFRWNNRTKTLYTDDVYGTDRLEYSCVNDNASWNITYNENDFYVGVFF